MQRTVRARIRGRPGPLRTVRRQWSGGPNCQRCRRARIDRHCDPQRRRRGDGENRQAASTQRELVATSGVIVDDVHDPSNKQT
jgi:hypothetical protein